MTVLILVIGLARVGVTLDHTHRRQSSPSTQRFVPGWWPGVVVSALASINEVNQRRARLKLRWVTVSGAGHLSRYVASHPG